MKDWITETDRDNLCDMLWWLKGYKKGADNNMDECPFQERHIDTLDNIVRGMREQLNKKDEKIKPVMDVPFDHVTDSVKIQFQRVANWSRGRNGGCIVSNCADGITIGGAGADEKDRQYYGGYLIGESMSEPIIDMILKMHEANKSKGKLNTEQVIDLIEKGIVIRVADDKIYSNVPAKLFDASISPGIHNHKVLEESYGKSII